MSSQERMDVYRANALTKDDIKYIESKITRQGELETAKALREMSKENKKRRLIS